MSTYALLLRYPLYSIIRQRIVTMLLYHVDDA